MIRKCACILLVLGLVAAGLSVGAAPQGSGGAPWAVLIGPGFARFVPEATEWTLAFSVVADGWEAAPAVLKGAAVAVNGKTLPATKAQVTDAPWARAAGRLTEAQTKQVRASVLAGLRGEAPAEQGRVQLESLAGRLETIIRENRPVVLTVLGPAGLVAEGSHSLTITLDYEKDGQEISLVETTEVVIAAIPKSPGWFSADLHFHSKYSDGSQWPSALKTDLTNLGYYIGYLTEHTGSLIANSYFTSMTSAYPAACKSASDLTTSLFPGIEMEIGHKVLGVWNGDGHTLGYGVKNTTSLDDKTYGAQTGLNNINANNSPTSSSGIAHPTHLIYNWEDWTVTSYYGIELMSGPQSYFDINSGPATRWRSECARVAASSSSYRPSVRSGSDNHGSSWQTYVTHVKLASDSTWNDGTWEQRKAAVDGALKAGRTTISRKGSLAYITIDGNHVGSTLIRSSGTSMSVYVYIKPAVTGTYNLTLYRNNCTSVVWSRSSQSLTAGTGYGWSFSHSALSGTNYYWLYVSGADYGYTTPIYVKQ